MKGLTGVDAPYEPPENPDLVLDTTHADIDELVARVIELLNQEALIHLSDNEYRRNGKNVLPSGRRGYASASSGMSC